MLDSLLQLASLLQCPSLKEGAPSPNRLSELTYMLEADVHGDMLLLITASLALVADLYMLDKLMQLLVLSRSPPPTMLFTESALPNYRVNLHA